jgi:CsoR family transcriptional regulator, copper-sensing transcriptional repressor
MSNSKKQTETLKLNQGDADPKHNIVHRLQIAKGHLEKVLKMVEEGAYCIDVVHQSMAVQSALKKIDEIVLEDHLKTCVSDSIKAGKSDEAIKEVMEVLQKK